LHGANARTKDPVVETFRRAHGRNLIGTQHSFVDLLFNVYVACSKAKVKLLHASRVLPLCLARLRVARWYCVLEGILVMVLQWRVI